MYVSTVLFPLLSPCCRNFQNIDYGTDLFYKLRVALPTSCDSPPKMASGRDDGSWCYLSVNIAHFLWHTYSKSSTLITGTLREGLEYYSVLACNYCVYTPPANSSDQGGNTYLQSEKVHAHTYVCTCTYVHIFYALTGSFRSLGRQWLSKPCSQKELSLNCTWE